MKNAQAKIDALLDLLVDRVQDDITSLGSAIVTAEHREQLEWLVKMSNTNNQRQEKTGKLPGPQSKAAQPDAVSDAELVGQLKAGRDPDLFPRRGPRKGKRENAGLPLPPDAPFCAIHTDVVTLRDPTGRTDGLFCPDCAKEPAETFVSLKALL